MGGILAEPLTARNRAPQRPGACSTTRPWPRTLPQVTRYDALILDAALPA